MPVVTASSVVAHSFARMREAQPLFKELKKGLSGDLRFFLRSFFGGLQFIDYEGYRLAARVLHRPPDVHG